MKQIILALTAVFISLTAFAQDVTYVLFNRNCMNQLEYRYSYPNIKGENAVWAYSIKPNIQEHYIFMTKGSGHYSPEMPDGTISCRNLDLDDAFAASINRGAQQMLIVFQRQSGGYWLMPVETATVIARNGSRYFVRAPQSAFQFDTLRMVNEQNLAIAGSPTAAYFSGAKLNNCQMEYSFHCQPVKTGQIRSDFQFIPAIGITNDRTGTSASDAMENELQLVKVNGTAIDDYLTEMCPEGSGKIAISKYEKPARYGDEKFEADKEITSIMQKEQDERPVAHDAPDGITCADLWEPGTHIVQKGENLRAIARTYKVSEQDLVKWNKIKDANKIEICQKIWLKQPPAAGAKGTSAKGAPTKPRTVEEQITDNKKVKMQGGQVKGAATVKEQKNYDPNRPIRYDEGSDDENDYSYFDGGTKANTSKSRIHTVHRGEYLYKIAKMYGCPEECIRIANGFALEGDEPLSIGQELIIPECTCTVNGKVIKAPVETKTVPEKPQPTVKKQSNVTEKQPYEKKQPKASILDESELPNAYNYDDEEEEKPAAKPKAKNSDLYEESSLYDDETSRTNDKKTTTSKTKKGEQKVQLFKEHHVKQGETLNSIAAKYKVSASELSAVNGLNPKESITPGKLILIPIEETED